MSIFDMKPPVEPSYRRKGMIKYECKVNFQNKNLEFYLTATDINQAYDLTLKKAREIFGKDVYGNEIADTKLDVWISEIDIEVIYG